MNPGLPSEPRPRSPDEVRAYERSVWDLTRNLIHPAFLYVVFQVTLWCGIERNPGFRGAALSFWEHTWIHALQFLGAWGVFYGTLLRDMRFQTRTVTIVLWLAAAGAAAVWLWPGAGTPDATPALRAILYVELAAGLVGWLVTIAAWFRAKALHSARDGGAGHG
jgi:hypothetical protein